MNQLVFSCFSPTHEFQKCQFPSDDLDVCFEGLNYLVSEGWRLVDVHLVEDGKLTHLPVHAFDMAPMRDELSALQTEWERLLHLS